MKVVVGKKDTPTPIFADDMTYIIFAPYWNVPPEIAAKETLPRVLSDPAFLQKMNMEVLDAAGNVVDPGSIDQSSPGAYRFRQRPGASNSLGLVKFMFPNQYDIYLHDTPADSLFARAVRSFSHGCVRLEQPEQLLVALNFGSESAAASFPSSEWDGRLLVSSAGDRMGESVRGSVNLRAHEGTVVEIPQGGTR